MSTNKLSLMKRRAVLTGNEIIPLVADGKNWSGDTDTLAGFIAPKVPIAEEVSAIADQVFAARDDVVPTTGRFLGVSAVAPTERKDGSALVAGDVYTDTHVPPTSYVWIGTFWTAIANPSDASQVSFQQAGSDVQRDVKRKLEESISLSDMGGVGDSGATDNGPALLKAIAEANGRPIFVPLDDTGGQYAVTSGNVAIPAGTRFVYEGGAKIYATGSGVLTDASNSVNHLSTYGGMRQYLRGDFTGTTDKGHNYNYVYIVGDQINAATKVDGHCVEMHFGGPNARGGRHTIEAFCIQDQPTSSANTDRFYVGLAATATTTTGDGGTASDATGKGGYFGANIVGNHRGGQYVNNVTACEFNTTTTAVPGGNEIYIHSGIQLGSRVQTRGMAIDAQISCTAGGANNTDPTLKRWRHGILFSKANGGYPLGTDSTMIGCSSDGTILRGLNLPQCTEYIIQSGDVKLSNGNLTMSAPGAALEIGSTSSAGSTYIDTHSSGFPVDYDVRQITSGGSATNGMGNYQIIAGASITLSSATTVFTGALRPSADAAVNFGAANYRVDTVFAKNSIINTSDRRAKRDFSDLADESNFVDDTQVAKLFEAWGDVRYAVFRFIDSVEAKGDQARWHVGLIAQQVVEAFSARGLDATKYGFLCHDVWDDEYEEWADEYKDVPDIVSDLVDRLGDPIIIQPAQRVLIRAAGRRLIRAAGDLYGIRYEETNALDAAYMRWRCEKLEARLAALELNNTPPTSS